MIEGRNRLPNDSFWVLEETLLAGPYPGSADPAEIPGKLSALFDLGVRVFVDLTEEDEGLLPYAPALHQLGADHGIEVVHYRRPIRDVSIPTIEQMQTTIATIRQAIRDDNVTYVHCWGGVGRTGTVIGCLLVEDGMRAGEAIHHLAHLRRFTARATRVVPETAEQHRFIAAWR